MFSLGHVGIFDGKSRTLAIKILPNAGQEQNKGLEESAAHTQQILWRVPPHPPPLLYQNSTKYWSGTG